MTAGSDMTSSPFAHLPYRPCVGIALFNNMGEVFVGERIDTPGAWQMPQGGIDAGEDVIKAALRELEEEIGSNKARFIMQAEETVKYNLPDHMIPKLWNGQFQGQEQHWVAMRFEGIDSDIKLDAWDHPEFSAWEWVALEDCLERIVPFKRDVYAHVIKSFSSIASTV